MKELYERTVFDIVEFEDEDIVTTSPTDPTENTCPENNELPGAPIL